MKQTTRILWLSDIHYRSDFNNNSLLKRKIDGFLETVEKYLENEKRTNSEDSLLQFIVLSGDLGFKGNADDYRKLEEELIGPLKIRISKQQSKIPLFLCCPGNHDVNREFNQAFKKYVQKIQMHLKKEEVKSISPAQKLTNELKLSREAFLNDYGINTAKKVFNEYTKFVLSLIEREYLNPNNLEIRNYIKNKCLYGYVIDHENQVVFNIINTAWFSLGDDFDRLIAQYYSGLNKMPIIGSGKIKPKVKSKDDLNKYIKEILKVKEFCSEYGHQVAMIGLLKNENFMENLNEFPHYTAFTIFHHPINWLEEHQIYDYKNNGETDLIKLIKKTDFLLTGHEHVNINITPEHLFNTTVHIPGGMFIQDQHNVERGGQNRFCIIELDNIQKTAQIRNYIWGQSIASSSENWYEYKKSSEIKKWNLSLAHKPSYFLMKKHLINIREKFQKKFDGPTYLSKFLVTEKEVFKTNKKGNYKSLFQWQIISQRNDKLLIIKNLIKSEELFRKPEILELIFNFFDDFAKKSKNNTKYIIFLHADVIAEPEIALKYLSDFSQSTDELSIPEDAKINSVYNTIQKKIDFDFNFFRNEYFNRFEFKKSTDKGRLANRMPEKIKFEDLIDLRFSNFLVPFWLIKKNLKN